MICDCLQHFKLVFYLEHLILINQMQIYCVGPVYQHKWVCPGQVNCLELPSVLPSLLSLSTSRNKSCTYVVVLSLLQN